MVGLVTETVFIPSNPQPSDVIFVFGSWFGDNWDQIIDLYTRKLGPIIYIGGGGERNNLPDSISHLIRNIFIEKGIPKEVIITDESSCNTLEDALSAKTLFSNKERPIFHKRILFVAKSFHSGRCLRTLKKVFPHSELFPFSYNFVWNGKVILTEILRDNWWGEELSRSAVWGEYQRIKRYSERGDISQ